MFKSKMKIGCITFILFVILFLSIKNLYAGNFESEDTNWKVTITSDTKDLEDTQEISFIPENNPNVVAGKMAPGMKATAEIEIDLTQVNETVETVVKVDESELPSQFELTAYIDGEKYELGEKVQLQGSTTKNVILELYWKDSEQDEIFENTVEKISIPFMVTVSQVI